LTSSHTKQDRIRNEIILDDLEHVWRRFVETRKGE